MVLRNIKTKDKTEKNEGPEMVPEVVPEITEEEPVEEVEEKVFNHPQQQQQRNSQQQFQPNDDSYFMTHHYAHYSYFQSNSLFSFYLFYSPFFAGIKIVIRIYEPVIILYWCSTSVVITVCSNWWLPIVLFCCVDVAHIDYVICDDVTIFTFCQMKIKTNADIVQVHVFFFRWIDGYFHKAIHQTKLSILLFRTLDYMMGNG